MASINDPGIHRRKPDELHEDIHITRDNVRKDSWKSWPNKAGFDNLTEHRGPLPLKVKGTIPAWAAGSLYRTGPGQSKLENTPKGTHYVSHWFDGFAHTHKFEILPDHSAGVAGSRVEYSSRRQGEDYTDKVRKKGWTSEITFGQKQDPCVGMFSKMMSVFQTGKASARTYNVVVEADVPALSTKAPASTTRKSRTPKNVFITTDTSTMQEIDPETLESVNFTGQTKLHPELTGELAASHSQRDPETGDFFNFNLKLGPSPTYRIFRVSAATGQTEILATVSGVDAPPAYIHSLFLTENYVVLGIPSSQLSANGLGIVWKRNICDAIVPFDKKNLTRWLVVDRRQGKGVVGRFSTPASFFFHAINAFEEKILAADGSEITQISLDACSYNSLDIIFAFYYDIILGRNNAYEEFYHNEERREGARVSIRRIKLQLPDPIDQQSRPGEEVFSISNPHAGELPTFNSQYAGQPYRYVYSIASRGLSTLIDCIVKTDLQTKEVMIWSGTPGTVPGECIFVPRPGGGAEDDGVLLTVVLDGTAGTSYLLCLDAGTLEELGRAEADFPIAYGIHGLHVSKGQDDDQ